MAIRPRIQRAFFAWLQEAAPRFAIPVQFEKRTDRWLELSFGGITPALRATLTRYDLSVAVIWEGWCWDLLISRDVSLVRVPGGYACAGCEPEKRQVFRTRDELWADHLFEPLVEWVNTELANAEFLVLYQTEGCTWANLATEERPGDEPAALVGLRT